MKDFLSKFENFLFDILGLILPGIIFLFVLFMPLYSLNLPKITPHDSNGSYILSGLETISKMIHQEYKVNTNFIIVIVIILAYLMGHVVKVFSIILYEVLTVIFDKSINPIVSNILDWALSNVNKCIKRAFNKEFIGSPIYKYLTTLISPIKNTFTKVFTFKSSDYFSDNDSLRTDCINQINQKLGTNYPDKWYSLYKFSKILNSQEKISSLSDHFLAKYNLYRSLSFIFLCATIYYHYFFIDASNFISPELTKIKFLIFLTSILFWFTFHYKYKRYWTLCGNETLVSLYYYLNKKKLNEP